MHNPLSFTPPSQAVWLESSRKDAENSQDLRFENPLRCIIAQQPEEVETALKALDEAVSKGFYVAGFMAYEAAYAFENIGSFRSDGLPLVWFGVYEAPQQGLPAPTEAPANPLQISGFEYDEATYTDRIRQIKQAIFEGDTYQINFTGQLTGECSEPCAAYYALRPNQAVGYSAFLNLGKTQILSFSPELFFRRKGSQIFTRPMKGTAPRGKTRSQDLALAQFLQKDAKNKAENLMIVDLLRNDLSKICLPQSVHVPKLFAIEPYETVLQMTSTVEGTLRPQVTYAEIFQALFPCGSVTGAPKTRAMQYIHRLENQARGVYCGTIGYISPHQEAVFNVAIRTLIVQNQRFQMGLGSGIVWDSDPHDEFAECQLKSQFLIRPPRPSFSLLEALRYENGYAFLAQHLTRLAETAAYFGFKAPISDIELALKNKALSFKEKPCYKVRLVLAKDGTFELSAAPYTDFPPPSPKICLHPSPVQSENIFLYHKTTQRTFYEQAYQTAAAQGYREVIFQNERGELTEGARTNIWIRKGDKWQTPTLASGLLAGVYRQHLLTTLPNAQEAPLFPHDLATADAVYCVNVMRGLEEVAYEG